MQKVVGIDLGTSNSCVAIVENGIPMVIANRGGYKTTPSIVAMTEKKRRVVGHLAKRQMITNARHTVHAVKRLIGRSWTSPQVMRMRETASYGLVEGPHGDVRVSLRDRVYSIPEISAMVLAEMKTTVKIIVMQGASERADENELLGEFELQGLRRATARAVSIAVTFAINADGIVSIAAKDVESGLEQSISVTATSGLTKEEKSASAVAG